ncbi:MAG: hypothetical protein J6J03_05255 [Tyzzerella sp.]|nr:hypothetical protein [Tyzzerella sp.]
MHEMTEVERKQIEWLIWYVLRQATSDDYASTILNLDFNLEGEETDTIMDDIIHDVMETSAWEDEGYYNEDDVRLAIGRTLLLRLGIDH